jgi:hypothetical protein
MNKKQLLLVVLLGLIFTIWNAETTLSRFRSDLIKNVIASDGLGYYSYLPYFFVYHDVLHQEYAMPLENGNSLNKYTCGVAILQMPFFLSAKQLSSVFDCDPSDVHNLVYMYAMACAVAAYLYIALCVLFFYIKNKFDRKTAWYCVVILYAATNVYYYTVMEPGMSHVYSLFCFAMILYFTDRYYKNDKIGAILGFSFFYALAVLIRPTNIVMILFFLFYEVYSIQELKFRILQHIKNYYVFIILIVTALIVASPQMLYWYAVTGKPVVFSYGYNHESFSNWKSPKIIQVLIGHKSGWLTHTPVMIFSLIGLYLGMKAKKISAPVISIVFAITLVICASWWTYNFSCSFGYRSFIEYYAILLLPVAVVAFNVLNGKNRPLILSFLALTGIFIFMNFRIMYLYQEGPDCWSGADWHWSNYFNALKTAFYLN